MNFNDILEAVDVLSLEDQIELREILDKRLIEKRREELAGEIDDANKELASGNLKVQSVDEIMDELTDEL